MSTLSRVVPGRSWTTERSSPISRLNSVDLPTLGRPTMATEGTGAPARRPARFPATVGGQAGHHLVEQVPGAPAVEGADRVGVAETEPGEDPGIAVTAVAIHLVGDHQGGPAEPAQQARHPGVLVGDPDGGVDHSTTTAASAMARSAWALTERARSSPLASHPPVSTMLNSCPAHSASRTLRSLVTPGCSSTMASRRPRMRLTSVLFPTLGRPTTATTGRGPVAAIRCRPFTLPGNVRAARRAAPSAGTTSTGRGRSSRPRPSRNRPPGEAHVGQQVAAAGGAWSQGGDEVGAGEQAGHADVAAEEAVGDRQHLDVRRGGRYEGPEHGGAVGAGQNGDRGVGRGRRVTVPGARGAR